MATESQRPDGERQFTGPGVDITVLAGGDDTDGAVSVFEYAAEAGFQGPPAHWHSELVEGFYLLEGTITVSMDGSDRTVTPGEYVLVPTRTVHSFAVADDEPARFLLHVSPGGFEGYFAELDRLMAEEPRWPPEDMRPVQELMEWYDTHAPPVDDAERPA